jgi:ketosteroid isomerase-like protein
MERAPVDIVREFMEAWEACDLLRLLSVVDDEIVFMGTTGPEPGRTFSGKESFVAAVAPLMSPTATIKLRSREMFEGGEAVIVTWETIDSAAQPSHARMTGLDVFRVSSGKIVLKDAYRKSYEGP